MIHCQEIPFTGSLESSLTNCNRTGEVTGVKVKVQKVSFAEVKTRSFTMVRTRKHLTTTKILCRQEKWLSSFGVSQ